MESSIWIALVLPNFNVTRDLAGFEHCLIFYFTFCQFPTIIFSSFFLKLVISLVIPRVLLHFRCCDPSMVGLSSTKWLNYHQLTGMVYSNHSSLMILVNDAKYIQCLPFFSTASLKLKTKLELEILLFRYKCWLYPLWAKY